MTRNSHLSETEFVEKNYALRKRLIEVFSALGFGHLTTAFSETEFLSYLYYNVIDPEKDICVLSKGHGAGMFYPILEDLGLLGSENLGKMLRLGGNLSKLKESVPPGFDFYGGSLGIGFGYAAGLALGNKLQGVDSRTFCVLGDAECYEGSVWEAAMFAGHYELDKLTVILDRNRLGCSDFTENMVRLEPFEEKWRAMNWDVIEIDGHNYQELERAFQYALEERGKPVCIIAETTKGKGIPSICNIPLKHGFMSAGAEAEELIGQIERVYGNA